MNRDLAVTNETHPGALFDWLLSIGACLVLFGPLLAVSLYYANPFALQLDTAAETVGIGVILRAMLRRVFRSGARSAMQTAVGTVTRASSRTMTRRIVRVGVKSITSLVRQTSVTTMEEVDGRQDGQVEDAADASRDDENRQSTWWALTLGFVALALSFAGMLLVLDLDNPPAMEDTSESAALLNGMPLPVAVLLGAMPIVVYAVLLVAAAPIHGANVRFRTGWEALLLQAYFTGSGSFLPLSTDSEISGPPAARARMALVSLVGLLALHLVFLTLAHQLNSYPLHFVSGMFLLYCFVFSFPISPLDGYHLWAYSRWLWAAVALPVLVLFVVLMPESLYVIL